MDKIDDWYRYFGDSTVYRCGKSGLSVHMPDTGQSCTEDREQDGTETEDSGGLGEDHERDSD